MVGHRAYHDITKMFRPPLPSEIIAIETARTTMDCGHPLHDEIEEIIGNKEVYCFIKYFDTEVKGITVRRHLVLKVYTEDDMIHPVPPTHPPIHINERTNTPIAAGTTTQMHPTVDTSASHTNSTTPFMTELTTATISPSTPVEKATDTAETTCGTKRNLSVMLASIV